MPQTHQITEDSPLLHDANCVYCHVDLELGDQVAVCDDCQSPHHRDCWQANRNRCATFGCSGAGFLLRLGLDSAPTQDRVEDEPQSMRNRPTYRPESSEIYARRAAADRSTRKSNTLDGLRVFFGIIGFTIYLIVNLVEGCS